MFETQVLREAGVERGLVFVSTDHGFNLGFDPSAKSGSPNQLYVARLRNDSLDHLTWQKFGHLPAYTYAYDLSGASPPRVAQLALRPRNPLQVSGLSLWPLPTSGGATVPVHNPDGLRLMPWQGHTLEAALSLPISRDNHYQLEFDVVSNPSTLVVAGWPLIGERRVDNGHHVTFGPVELKAGKTRLSLRANREMTLLNVSLVALDELPIAPFGEP